MREKALRAHFDGRRLCGSFSWSHLTYAERMEYETLATQSIIVSWGIDLENYFIIDFTCRVRPSESPY